MYQFNKILHIVGKNKYRNFWVYSFLYFTLVAILAGCTATNTIAKGISEKSLSGSGVVSDQRVGIDPETKTPVLKSFVVNGDYASARDNQTAFQYRRKESPSIFNSQAITREITINYIGGEKERFEQTMELVKQDILSGDATAVGVVDSGIASK